MRNTQKYPFSVLFNSIFFLYKTWMSVRISKLIEVCFQKFNLIFFVRVKYKKIHSMNFAVHKSVFQTSLFSIPNGQTVGTVFVIQDYLPILFNESTKNLFCKKYLIGKSCKMLFRLHYFFKHVDEYRVLLKVEQFIFFFFFFFSRFLNYGIFC